MTSQVRNLRCRSIGVREATDLIGLVSVSGRVGGCVCVGGGSHRSRREDGLSCRHGVKPPLTHS